MTRKVGFPMTSNLPEVQPVTLGGQTALWADPRQLLDFDEASLRRLAAEVGHEAGGVLAQVRRAVGLVAWAAWYRMPEKDYRAFAEGLAGDLDIEVETLRNWRRAVVRTDKLPVPGVAALRAGEAAKGRKTAGQPTGALSPTAPSGVIPAASTEAPANSKGAGKNGAGSPSHSAPGDSAARPGSPAPLDPSPVGGNALGEVSAPPAAVPPEEPCCDYRDHSPGPCACPDHEQTALHPFGGLPAKRPPSDRALTARVFAAMRDVDPTDAGPVTTPEEATFLRQWAQRTLDAWKAKNVPVVAPRPAGRVIKPGDRKAKAEALAPYQPTWGPLAKPAARITPTTARIGGKRHADDCSCLSCAPPKEARA